MYADHVTTKRKNSMLCSLVNKGSDWKHISRVEESVNVGLGKGQVGSFPETYLKRRTSEESLLPVEPGKATSGLPPPPWLFAPVSQSQPISEQTASAENPWERS